MVLNIMLLGRCYYFFYKKGKTGAQKWNTPTKAIQLESSRAQDLSKGFFAQRLQSLAFSLYVIVQTNLPSNIHMGSLIFFSIVP